MPMVVPHVVVTLDGSALSEAALPVAGRLARCLGARVSVVRVVPPPSTTGAGAAAVSGDEVERHAPDDLAAHAAGFLDIEARPVVLVGADPAATLIAWFQQQRPDFIVMATHGHGGRLAALAGSVTETVLRAGIAPVVAVRPRP